MTISASTQAKMQSKNNKILIVYFSHSGNTRIVAEKIKNATGGAIFEIIPTIAYPTDYNTVVDQAKKEISKGYKPELKSKINNIEQYDIIFVGSPNWWSTFAPPVATFLSSYNFNGKTIVPFITHEGSEMGHSVADIKKLCPKANVLNGLAIKGTKVNNSDTEISKWLKENKINTKK